VRIGVDLFSGNMCKAGLHNSESWKVKLAT